MIRYELKQLSTDHECDQRGEWPAIDINEDETEYDPIPCDCFTRRPRPDWVLVALGWGWGIIAAAMIVWAML